jgi:ParB family chromosome partitioning protein
MLPLIVRPIDKNINGQEYEILSGHNRANAARIAGLDRVPVIIKDRLTDEEAMLIVTETNLRQRSFADLSHSERASVLTEHYNAIKQQGKRTDLLSEIEMLSNADNFNEKATSSQFATKFRTDDKVGENYNLSKDKVARYIRIGQLINELKERLDNGEIPFIAAVDISFLKAGEQELLEELLQDNPSYKLDIKKADMIKSLSLGRSLTEERISEILSGKYFKSNKPKSKAIKIKPKLLKRFFNEEQPAEIEKIIEEALEFYFNRDI